MNPAPLGGIVLDASDPGRSCEFDDPGILDPGRSLDDVVQIAREICAAPAGLISLVASDRQRFEARAGFPGCGTELFSLCAFASGEPDLLVIPDLSRDSRLLGNPLVTGEPHIRFYAGAPLRMPCGKVVGSLCVVDDVRRPDGLTEGQSDAMRRLARQVVILMRERRHLARLRASAALAQATAARRTALVELGDLLRDVSTVSEITARAAGIVGRTLGAGRAGYGELDETGEFVTLFEDWRTPGMSSVVGRHRLSDYGAIAPVIAQGDVFAVSDVTKASLTAGLAAMYAAFGIGSMLNVPLREQGRTVGVFYVHAPSARTWTAEEVAFARNVADRVQVGIGRLRAEEQQAFLNRELSHRMKNTLAMVQAIAVQTMRNAVDLETARDALAARLVAMGKAHDILLDGAGAGAGLETVARAALAIHDDAQANRLRFVGPFVHVGSKAALSLALVMHELATNAVKYGALSVPDGYVSVAWSVDHAPPPPSVRLRWSEHGGPTVSAPTRQGFGSRLIERGLAGAIGGVVTTTYASSGVVCELVAPLAGIEAEA